MNRQQRRAAARQKEKFMKDEEGLIQWVSNLTERQKDVIAAVVDEKVHEKLVETDKFMFECFGQSLEIVEDMDQDRIKHILEYMNGMLNKFKYSKLKVEDMNKADKEKVYKTAYEMVEKNLLTEEAVDQLHSLYPSIRSDELTKVYREARNNYSKPTIKLLDDELERFDHKKDKMKEDNHNNYLKRKAAKEVNKKEDEVKMEDTTQFEVIEKQITLKGEYGIYKVTKEGITTNILGEDKTFQNSEEASKYIGKIVSELTSQNLEIEAAINYR